ncbi:hypothetical protein D3C85_1528390 [compost metagenome]
MTRRSDDALWNLKRICAKSRISDVTNTRIVVFLSIKHLKGFFKLLNITGALGVAASLLNTVISGDGDRSQDANDDNDDQEFDNGKAIVLFLFYPHV